MANNSRQAALPIHCLGCGKEYGTLTDFIGLTEALSVEPPLISEDEEHNATVTLVRVCSCGGEVRVTFRERRDTTKKGEEKRALFDRLQKQLLGEGVSSDDAHEELLNLIHGRPCPIMKELAYKELYSK